MCGNVLLPGTEFDVSGTAFLKQFSICVYKNVSLGLLLGLVDLYERLGTEREKRSYVVFFFPKPWSARCILSP